jgi:hypothetical protein
MKNRKPISKLIDLIMAFAIFWLVIGDLITYHQVHVYGIDLFDTQSPFTVPKGKDDGKTASYKSTKGIDEVNNFLFSLHPFIKPENIQNLCITRVETWFGFLQIPATIKSRLEDLSPPRAPPV